MKFSNKNTVHNTLLPLIKIDASR